MNTLLTIATSLGKDKRTVQLWYQKHKEETGIELGQKEGANGTRYFTDKESEILCSYGNSPNQEATPVQATVETGNHYMVLSTPHLPQTYSLGGLRSSEAVGFEDPLAIAARFLQDADAVQLAMQADIVQRQQRLAATQQAKNAIAAKTQQLQLEARLYQMESQGLDTALTNETQQLSEHLQQLNSMGKPAIDAGQS